MGGFGRRHRPGCGPWRQNRVETSDQPPSGLITARKRSQHVLCIFLLQERVSEMPLFFFFFTLHPPHSLFFAACLHSPSSDTSSLQRCSGQAGNAHLVPARDLRLFRGGWLSTPLFPTQHHSGRGCWLAGEHQPSQSRGWRRSRSRKQGLCRPSTIWRQIPRSIHITLSCASPSRCTSLECPAHKVRSWPSRSQTLRR